MPAGFSASFGLAMLSRSDPLGTAHLRAEQLVVNDEAHLSELMSVEQAVTLPSSDYRSPAR